MRGTASSILSWQAEELPWPERVETKRPNQPMWALENSTSHPLGSLLGYRCVEIRCGKIVASQTHNARELGVYCRQRTHPIRDWKAGWMVSLLKWLEHRRADRHRRTSANSREREFGGLYPPAAVSVIESSEEALGFPLPPLLREI